MGIKNRPIYRILIVEDEILIADTIQRYIKSIGHEVVGIGISYEEGLALFHQKKPDLLLVDIRLSGTKTGIDLAHSINQSVDPKPFMFLTAQIDSKSIGQAKETLPLGYLTKPLQKQSLLASIEIAMHKYYSEQKEELILPVNDGGKNHLIPISEILFLQSEHIYVRVHTQKGVFIQRVALKEFIAQLPDHSFIQTHRSFVVNLSKITNWDSENIYIDETIIPISRGKKKWVIETLNQRLTPKNK